MKRKPYALYGLKNSSGRMAKIHTEHGWQQIGVGKEGEYYAIVLRRMK